MTKSERESEAKAAATVMALDTLNTARLLDFGVRQDGIDLMRDMLVCQMMQMWHAGAIASLDTMSERLAAK